MSPPIVIAHGSAGLGSRGRETPPPRRPRRRSASSGSRLSCARPAKVWAPKVTFLVLLLVGLVCVPTLHGCEGDDTEAIGATTSSSTVGGGPKSGDIDGRVGDALEVGSALVTVRALQSTFQPALPAQRLSEQTPTAPGAGESFYQAYVRVENLGADPVRVDPNHFACAIGDTVSSVEPTRSGPLPRSLLKNASLDLLLTFKGPAGYEPLLLYDPPWYRGTVRVSPESVETDSTITE